MSTLMTRRLRMLHWLVLATLLAGCTTRATYRMSEARVAVQRSRADSLAAALERAIASRDSVDASTSMALMAADSRVAAASAQIATLERKLATEPAGVADLLRFDVNSADIVARERPVLDRLVATLQERPDARVALIGRADARGNADYNLRLSERRVESVRAFLMNEGIPEWRMEAIRAGEFSPFDSAQTDSAWADNRSVQVAVVDRGEDLEIASTPNNASVFIFRRDTQYPRVINRFDNAALMQNFRVTEGATTRTVKRPRARYNLMLTLPDGKRVFACDVQVKRPGPTKVHVDFGDTSATVPCMVADDSTR